MRRSRGKIDLTEEYPRESRGWRLQVDLDHVGQDLNLTFHGIRSQKEYEAFDMCLKRLEDIFQKGMFYEHMVDRRRSIRKRQEASVRLQEIIARIVKS